MTGISRSSPRTASRHDGGVTEYLELAEAAQRMGLTSEALKKRLIRGTVPGRKVDGRWMVLVSGACHPVTPDVTTRDDDRHDGRHDDDVTLSPHSVELIRALDLVERQQQTIMELSGRCGWLQSELQQTRTHLEVAEQEIRLLRVPSVENLQSPDPRPTETSNHPAPAANGQDSGAQCPPRRRWWEFWQVNA